MPTRRWFPTPLTPVRMERLFPSIVLDDAVLPIETIMFPYVVEVAFNKIKHHYPIAVRPQIEHFGVVRLETFENGQPLPPDCSILLAWGGVRFEYEYIP